MEVRIGVIGTGAIGRAHAQRLSEVITGCRVTAVSDINEEAARNLAERVGAAVYREGEELIAAPDVDAVVVTAWDEAHARYVLAAIRAGKYVFCEKPLATEVEACAEIVEAEMKLGRRIVQVGFMRRYDPGYAAMKEIIQSGRIGAPLMIHACHRNMTHASNMTSEMSIKNSGIHEIDVFRWLLEEEYSQGQVVLPKQNRIAAAEGLQDPQIMMLTTQSGVAIDVEISQSSGYGYDIQCEVVGELGTVRLPEPPVPVTRIAGSCAHAIMPGWETRFLQAYDIEFQKWVDEVKAEHITGPTAWDGYMACLTADALGEARIQQDRRTILVPARPEFYQKA
ncbi:MAG: Gfo/Idh/MocA family oxidoreductase [Lachnospiraceae bacterium]